MSRYGWPCSCSQCLGDDYEPDDDDFIEWAQDEIEREIEAATDDDIERATHDMEHL